MNDEPPSIVEQARQQDCRCEFYDFGKAQGGGIEFYNPAICRRRGQLWLVARRAEPRDGYTYGFNSLMAFSLDANHWPQFGIPLKVPRAETKEHFEDPRLFSHDGRDWISACNFIIHPDGETWTGAHQCLLEIDEEWRVTKRHDPVYGNNGRTVRKNIGDEKNWLWFSHNGVLHMIYMTVPHTVTRWSTMADPVVHATSLSHPGWVFGTPRGGSAPVRVGDEYFSFFHSSMPWRGRQRRYYMGAYSFDASPPFTIRRMTPEPLLIGTQADEWRERKPLVVFPCAAIVEVKDNQSQYNLKGAYSCFDWTVSLGVNDLRSAHFHISHEQLLEKLDDRLEPVDIPPTKSVLESMFR